MTSVDFPVEPLYSNRGLLLWLVFLNVLYLSLYLLLLLVFERDEKVFHEVVKLSFFSFFEVLICFENLLFSPLFWRDINSVIS